MVFTQKPVYQNNIQVILKPKNKQKIKADLFRTQRNNPIDYKVNPREYLVNYNDIDSDFIEIVKKWYSYNDKIDIALSNYFDNFYNHTNIENQLLNNIKSLEAYHREFVRPSRLNQLDRYIGLFTRTSRSFNPYLKIHSKVKYCEKLRDIRNDLTHNNPTRIVIQKNFKQLYRLVSETRLILTTNILFDIGIKLSDIKKLIGKSSAFNDVKR